MKRSMLLAVIALVGLTVTGVAYAAWTQSITVEGNVQTGTFDIKWVDPQTDRTTEPTFGTAYVAAIKKCTLSNNDHTLEYEVENAFPGWSSKITVTIKNAGSTPAALSFVPDEDSTLEVQMSPNVQGEQLGTGGEIPVEITVKVPYDLEEEGTENNTYFFTLTVNGAQWYQEGGGS